MCGFVAVLGRREEDRVASAMLDAIRSRGPDDRVVHSTDWFTLGFCRLSIFSLAAGRQPVTSADGSITLAFNGEIYNFHSLADELEQQTGVRARSEAELLLTGYQVRGPDLLQQLDGDFAIAIFDSRRRTCELWRDLFGVKPLYYATLPGKEIVLVASEIRGLLPHPDLAVEWDEVALGERSVLSFWARDRTAFRGVRQVQPGHRMVIGPCDPGSGAPAIAEFPPPPSPTDTPPPAVGDELVTACVMALMRSVTKRVQHTHVAPVVLALSGGVDSSILAALAQQASLPTVAVTICSNTSEADPRYASAVAGQLDLPHHVLEVTPEDLLQALPSLVLAHPANGVFLALLLGEAIDRFEPGAKVLLCGEGADEIFLGYPVHRNHLPFVANASKRLDQLSEWLVNESQLLTSVRAWKDADQRSTYDEVVSLYADHQLVNRHLVPFDHGTMARSVECRVPYLDREVVQYRTHPSGTAMRKPLLRLVLAKAFEDSPELVRMLLTRPKAAAFHATRAARSGLRHLLEIRIPASPLAASHLAQYATNVEDLFWLGATHTVFMTYRGRIHGMEFHDLVEETLGGLGW